MPLNPSQMEVAKAVFEAINKTMGFHIRLTPGEKEIVDKLRAEIGYSLKTNDFDIWSDLVKITKKVLKIQKPVFV